MRTCGSPRISISLDGCVCMGAPTNRRFRNVRSAPATFCVRKWDRLGDWHYFTGMSAAAMRRTQSRESDVRLIDEYFYDYNA